MSFFIDRSLAWFLVFVVVVLCVYRICRGWMRIERGPRVVGIERLQLNYSKKLTPAPPIQLFDKEILTEVINDINDYLITVIMRACRKATEEGKTLQVEINTTGGDHVIARSVAGILRHFREENNLRIVVMGKCFSSGMIILMAADPSQRYAVSGSEFLIHATRLAETGVRDGRTRRFDTEVIEAITSGTRIEQTSLKALLESDGNCLFPAIEALEAGFIGTII